MRAKRGVKTHPFGETNDGVDSKAIIKESLAFLAILEGLRSEIILRDEMYIAAKHSDDKSKMDEYNSASRLISQKCLDYGRELCDQSIPHWVSGHLPPEKAEIAKHAYDMIRNKICASLNVFDNDLLPNARALVAFAEETA